MDKLRAPTAEERLKGLPATKTAAIKLGLTRFIPEDGVERIIRQYGSKKYPNGSVEKAPTRKYNRGAGQRKDFAKVSTPPTADLKQFGRKMVKAASQNLEGHHITPLFLSGKALLDMSSERVAQYFERFKKVGVFLGDSPENIMVVSPEKHRAIHKEGEAVQQKLKSMEAKSPSKSVKLNPKNSNKPKLQTVNGSVQLSLFEGFDMLNEPSVRIVDTGPGLPIAIP
jgi:hypothetical protein